MARLQGLLRLGHPFPSLLDGLVVAGVGVLAGADAPTALRLGASMTALQLAIGALNDVVDAPRDAGHKPQKPIPSGLVSRSFARIVAAACALVGLVLAVPSGLALTVLAVVVLAIGAAYDLRAKGTPWSWLPFALGIPLLPVYGWLGATGTIGTVVAGLTPLAVLAGAALAIANARVDVERDIAAGSSSIAAHLGLERSWWLAVALFAAAFAGALVVLLALGGVPEAALGIAAGGALVAIGLGLGRDGGPVWRERGWRVQAIGVALIGVVWVWGVVAAGA